MLPPPSAALRPSATRKGFIAPASTIIPHALWGELGVALHVLNGQHTRTNN